MPFESASPGRRRRIAVIGAGISGLGAAYALSQSDDVVLFEAERRIGGHARTVAVEADGGLAIDTGFIVFNDRNYPLLTKLFEALDTPTIPSNMSFGASFDDGALEYALRSLNSLFAQRRNLVRPAYLRMLADVLRFNRTAEYALADPGLTLGEYLDRQGLGAAFRDWYLLPFSAAIWSAAPADMLAFPAATFVRFFKNHGLLSARGQPQWRTVKGGSRVYVEQLATALKANGVAIRAGTPAIAVRHADGLSVRAAGGEAEAFDAVILACHADQAERLLAQPDADQTRILGALRYTPNRAVLHTDARQMPRRRACWSSRNYLGGSGKAGGGAGVGVTYWMNRLQSLPTARQYFVTLNPGDAIPDAHIVDAAEFAHPQFDRAAIAAQQSLPEIQGRYGIWYAGAYTRYGFHEDGLMSGLAAAQALGAAPAWA